MYNRITYIENNSEQSATYRAAQLPILIKELGGFYRFSPYNGLPIVKAFDSEKTYIAEEIKFNYYSVLIISGCDETGEYRSYVIMPNVLSMNSINEIYEFVYNAYLHRGHYHRR